MNNIKKVSLIVLIIIFIVLNISACGKSGEVSDNDEEISTSLFAMDTYMNINIFASDDAILNEVTNEINKLESLWSVTDEDSEIYKINKNGSAQVSWETKELLTKALEICDETDGALDISIYPIVHEWGFTTGDYKVPNPLDIEKLLKKTGYKKIKLEEISDNILQDNVKGEMSSNEYTNDFEDKGKDEKVAIVSLDEGMEIDLGSVGKGYTGDLISSMLKKNGVNSALLDLGGNIHTIGAKPDGTEWKVGIQNPDGEGYFAILKTADQAVITSGGYERFFEDDEGNIWWHIIDPKTGYPAKGGILSVTIISDEGVYCDGLSTAMFVKGKDEAIDFWKKHKDFDMILVTDDNNLIITAGIEEKIEVIDNTRFSEIEIIN